MFARYCWIFVFLSSPVFAAPQIQNWQTSNGARVYFVEAHELPMVDIQLNFDAGSARDPEQKKGLATLTNSLLDEGAVRMRSAMNLSVWVPYTERTPAMTQHQCHCEVLLNQTSWTAL
jgi:predicted Zn-dependent peptidase